MTNIVPFGKYKGQPVEVMAADHGYMEWLSSQAWFRERHQNIYTLIVNNFHEPSETPEHNKLQAKFLSKDFVRSFFGRLYNLAGFNENVKLLEQIIADHGTAPLGESWCWPMYPRLSKFGGYIDGEFVPGRCKDYTVGGAAYLHPDNWISGYYKRVYKNDLVRRIGLNGIANAWTVSAQFESYGFDVCVQMKNYCGDWYTSYVEIKPTLSDDYPAVLRQIKAAKLKSQIDFAVLYIGEYIGTGASFDDVKAIFRADNITIVKD